MENSNYKNENIEAKCFFVNFCYGIERQIIKR